MRVVIMLVALTFVGCQGQGDPPSCRSHKFEKDADYCCNYKLMDSASKVILDLTDPLLKGEFKALRVKLCGIDHLWIQLWQRVNGNSNRKWRLKWQKDIVPCFTNGPDFGDYIMAFPNDTAVIDDDTRIGLWSPTDHTSKSNQTDDKVALPYVYSDEQVNILHSDDPIMKASEMQLGMETSFDTLHYPRTFTRYLIFCLTEDCPASDAGGSPSIIVGPAGAQGPAGEQGAPGPPGVCPTILPPPGECEAPDLGNMPDDVENIKNEQEGMKDDVKDIKDILNDLLTSNTVTGTCDPGFQVATYGIGKCYRIIRERAQFGVALMRCKEDYGATMIALETEQEHRYIAQQIINSGVGDNLEEVFWTSGMNQANYQASQWVWFTGDVNKMPRDKRRIQGDQWAVGQPPSGNSQQKCLKIVVDPATGKAVWIAGYCTEWLYYICELPKKCL